MRLHVHSVAIFLATFAAFSLAVSATQPRGLCPEAHSQADLNDCFSSAARKSDARLKIFYRNYLRLLSGDDKSSLENSQSAWLLYRTAECKSQAGSTQSSGYTMRFDICINELTILRLRELKMDNRLFFGR
jgi:uncharacterized protein YecT (DUF1311 family)